MLIQKYLQFGFTCLVTEGIEKPQCVICLKVLSAKSMKPFQLKRHFEKEHPTYKDRDVSFFERKADSVKKSRLDTTGQTFATQELQLKRLMLFHCVLQNVRDLILLVKS